MDREGKDQGMIYLHAGADTMLRKKDVIGIFDLDNCSISTRTRDFLKKNDKRGQTVTVSDELPSSMIITGDGKVYLSPISTASLRKRWESKSTLGD